MVGLVVRLAVAVALLGGAGVATTASDLATGARTMLALASPAIVTSVSGPTDGALAGGAQLTVTGKHLDAVRAEIGGVSAALDVAADGTAVLTIPPADSGGGSVPIELFEGRSHVATRPIQFDYRVTSPVDQQLAYAIAYWDDYNLAGFGDFNPWGGDCQNFVSQTLVARGWVPNEEWFNDAQVEWTPAFVHVPSFDDYLRAHPELGAVAVPIDERDRIKLGDLVVYDWDSDGSLDHIEVVARIEHAADGRIAIATLGHSDIDSWYYDLDRAITLEYPHATAYFWSIP